MNTYYLDCGNTNHKLGIYLENKWQISPFSFERIEEGSTLYISDVGKFTQSQDYKTLTNKNIDIINFKDFQKDNLFLDMEYQYSQTLGIDRILQVYYLLHSKNLKGFVFVDAGSFITVDYVKEGKYLGGEIYPGIKNFLASYLAGADLPILETHDLIDYIKQEFNSLESSLTNTREAILSASKNYLHSIVKNEQNIILTGGDKKILSLLIQDEITEVENLIFDSMRFCQNQINKKLNETIIRGSLK